MARKKSNNNKPYSKAKSASAAVTNSGQEQPQSKGGSKLFIGIIAGVLGLALGGTLMYMTVLRDFTKQPEDDPSEDIPSEELPDTETNEFLRQFPRGIPAEYDDLSQNEPYSPSNGLDEKGHWAGIRALDYVDLSKTPFTGVEFPYFVHHINDLVLVEQMEYLLNSFPEQPKQILDRPVADGDRINIDYVGTLAGEDEPFEGGSTTPGGMGDVVIVGETPFIDDFLEQLIGHMPKDTVEVRVTFPKDYSEIIGDPGAEHLDGKEAVFVTTINFILEPEDVDVYVKRNFYEEFGWENHDDYKEGLRHFMQMDSFDEFFAEYFLGSASDPLFEGAVVEIPEQLRQIAVENTIRMLQSQAEHDAFDDFTTYLQERRQGMPLNIREIVRGFLPELELMLQAQLIWQAIAETLELEVTYDDVKDYLNTYRRNVDMEKVIEEGGLAFRKQETLGHLVRQHIIDNGVMLPPPPM